MHERCMRDMRGMRSRRSRRSRRGIFMIGDDKNDNKKDGGRRVPRKQQVLVRPPYRHYGYVLYGIESLQALI